MTLSAAFRIPQTLCIIGSLALLVGCLPVSTSEGQGESTPDSELVVNGDESMTATADAEGASLSTQPSTPAKTSSKRGVEVREFDAEADDVFPPRRVVAQYVNDQPHGECRAYDERGRLIFAQTFVDGKLHGIRTCYYPSGAKFSEYRFVKGLGQGLSTTWFPDGTVASTSMLKDGEVNGEQISYFSNGNRMVASTCVNGVTHGDLLLYLPDGRMYATCGIANGVEYDRHLLIDPTQADVAAMHARNEFSGFLKDHWPPIAPDNVAPPVPAPVQKSSPAAGETAGNVTFRRGDTVEVEWQGSWYPAEILNLLNGQYRIHYVGYGSNWDETVGPERIRTQRAAPRRLSK